MNKETSCEFDLALIPHFAEVFSDETKTDKVRELQFKALKRLRAQLNHYKNLGYVDWLLSAIAEKKGAIILTVTSKSEMEKLLRPACPHYNGSAFVPDEHSIPEEELICWSETSLRAPLNDAGFKRYMELFRQFFPEEAKELLI